ncbi:putative apses transcription factor [Phaeomoniella chlamydospora]|uniref:Cell pattern formation-associated protein stuA n=1 Tax=Phaeomoniella chlamydospora TaxID=158046 RepID=A0A0G2E990_PHACM|nr:putative apses transcription factor [Phaeomoniella chlamydospora]
MPRAEQQLGVTDQMTASGTKPSLIIFQWKDEGSLCYQIEVNGIHVTRREDNNFINASKLMMVARVPRQERYRLLKSEQNLHFVKRGSMHLRGIWIPLERALYFANKANVTSLVYPLFAENIRDLLDEAEPSPKASTVVPDATKAMKGYGSTHLQQLPPLYGSDDYKVDAWTHVDQHRPNSTMGGQVASLEYNLKPTPVLEGAEYFRALLSGGSLDSDSFSFLEKNVRNRPSDTKTSVSTFSSAASTAVADLAPSFPSLGQPNLPPYVTDSPPSLFSQKQVQEVGIKPRPEESDLSSSEWDDDGPDPVISSLVSASCRILLNVHERLVVRELPSNSNQQYSKGPRVVSDGSEGQQSTQDIARSHKRKLSNTFDGITMFHAIIVFVAAGAILLLRLWSRYISERSHLRLRLGPALSQEDDLQLQQEVQQEAGQCYLEHIFSKSMPHLGHPRVANIDPVSNNRAGPSDDASNTRWTTLIARDSVNAHTTDPAEHGASLDIASNTSSSSIPQTPTARQGCQQGSRIVADQLVHTDRQTVSGVEAASDLTISELENLRNTEDTNHPISFINDGDLGLDWNPEVDAFFENSKPEELNFEELDVFAECHGY